MMRTIVTKKKNKQLKEEKKKNKLKEEEIQKDLPSICWTCGIMRKECVKCEKCELATYCNKQHLEDDNEEHSKRCGLEKEGLTEIGLNKLLLDWLKISPSIEVIKIMKTQAIFMKKSIVLQIKPILSGEGILIQYLLAGCTFDVDGPLKLRLDFIYKGIRITKEYEIKLSTMTIEEAQRLAKLREQFHNAGICSFTEELCMFSSDTEIDISPSRRKIRRNLPAIEYSIGKITRESGKSHHELIRIEHIEYNPQ